MEAIMTLDIRDHTIEETHVTRDGNTPHNPAERHVFHTIEHIGNRGGTDELKQRLGTLAVAVLISSAIYAGMILDMYFSK
jgi:hypothetical protein